MVSVDILKIGKKSNGNKGGGGHYKGGNGGGGGGQGGGAYGGGLATRNPIINPTVLPVVCRCN